MYVSSDEWMSINVEFIANMKHIIIQWVFYSFAFKKLNFIEIWIKKNNRGSEFISQLLLTNGFHLKKKIPIELDAPYSLKQLFLSKWIYPD